MRNITKRQFAGIALGAVIYTLTGCSSPAAQQSPTTPSFRNPATEKLLENLKIVSTRGILFGHHDDTVYGIGWENEPGGSDVRRVCGDYPAVVSFDLGHLEMGDDYSLDKVPFAKIRQEAIKQYERGGLVSMSWHLRNPLTGGDSWDISDSAVVKSVLPGGSRHLLFAGWLDRLAVYMNSLKNQQGEKIPVLFRPWHEHTGSWFWWGADLCTPQEYKALWHMTVDSLRSKGVDNLLYAYSPGSEPRDTAQYLERYPGDDYIDLIGFDTYQFAPDKYAADMTHSLDLITRIGKAHDKPIAVTETGFEGIPDSLWWTGTLLPLLEPYPLTYVLVWRNARERITHYYAPYPGQVSASDFVRFYEHPRTLFASDTETLYK